MKEAVKSRWQFREKGRRTPGTLRALGIDFIEREGKDFWEANHEILPELYRDFQAEARTRLRELHPDTGGDHDEFADFASEVARVRRAFARHLEGRTAAAPREQPLSKLELRRQKSTAKARRYRARNRVKFRAARRARYARLKAEGRVDVSPEQRRATSRRYRERHAAACSLRQYLYRQRNPEKVRQWRRNYLAKAKERGLKRKRYNKKPGREIPGTLQHQKRCEWRRERWEEKKDKFNAARRVKNKQPRQRDAKGRYVARP